MVNSMAGRAATLAEGRGMDLDEEDEELRCAATSPRMILPPPPALAAHSPSTSPCRADEEARGQTAFEREYEDDHSWEELEEDEFGNLRAPVRMPACCQHLPAMAAASLRGPW
jgi:hypothetical protein